MLPRIFPAIGLILILATISGCNDEKILDNLTQEQANQTLSVLLQHNISAKKNGNLKAGYTVSVDAAENTAALSVINQYQLPWAADVQIGNAFPDSSLVSSPGAEQARVRSLQEQRLEQSLRIIAQVVNARVHISYPYFTNDVPGRKYASHIGILISYKGELDENIFISQIKTLIKNSIDDIRFENISVVLFHVPAIQYAAPLHVKSTLSYSWIMILFCIVLFVILLSGYFIYYKHKLKERNKTPTSLPVSSYKKEVSTEET